MEVVHSTSLNILRLKTVRELLLEDEFYVESYQRGYRWTVMQVEQLLEDLQEFFSSRTRNADAFYCLQPLVVAKKADKNNRWELIDGQQRISTIYLILAFLRKDKDCKPLIDKTYSMEYNTRTGSKTFLKKIPMLDFQILWEEYAEAVPEDDMIDNFHFFRAYQTIGKWFGDNHIVKVDFLNNLLDLSKFIWFQMVGKTDGEIKEAFERLNVGKIPLTNAELIRALFLKQDTDEALRNEISNKWSQIEYALQNDAFWYFLNPSTNQIPTRIEFIFDLISKKFETNRSKEEKFHTFFHFKNEADKDPEGMWKIVESVFEVLLQWFEDLDYYHYLGYLITIGKHTVANLIATFDAHDGPKSEFLRGIKTEIHGLLRRYLDSGLTYKESSHRPKIIHILLFFNIQSMMVQLPFNRFPFNKYKEGTPSLEHIHAQSTTLPTEIEAQKKWAQETLAVVELIVNEAVVKPSAISVLTRLKSLAQGVLEGDFQSLVSDAFSLTTDSDVGTIHELSNLALIDKDLNSSLSNSVFPVKRSKILGMELVQKKTNIFVPFCTRNVFLKQYSTDISQMFFWGKADQDCYMKAIESSISQLTQK